MKRKEYERELAKLQGGLVAMQEWVKATGAKVCIVFEGRDTAGKGGTIKRIVERVSPRVFRVVALPAPSEREKSQMYIQRYIKHFPAAGEVVIFDRSWYNRAGVERVMGFCAEEETTRFLEQVPAVEQAMIHSGILLIKYWLEVGPDEQTRRLESRIDDPRKIWKLSDMDLKSYSRWYDYSRARDAMFAATDTAWAPWWVAHTDDKKTGRLNIISPPPQSRPLRRSAPRAGEAAETPDPRVATRNRTIRTATSPRSSEDERREVGVTDTAGPPAGSAQAGSDVTWYTLAPDEVASRLQVDPAKGLTTAEAQARLQKYGPNALAEAKAVPVWKQFLKHYTDYMQIVLVVAAVVSLLIAEYRTGVMLILLTLFNAWLGYHQEGKAEAAAAALGKMMKAVTKVRRDGDVVEVPAEQVVPGDIVLVDAGDRVPADGRVIVAATLQIEEGALTGESVAAEKSMEEIAGPDVGVGDRVDMAFMNTNVTRGHGEILVTTTGMGSEVGHIAHMLAGQKAEKTPLTKQVDRLTIFIIIAAAFAFIVILVTGLAQGEDFNELFVIGVALAVGSIPDALPAVVTMILSTGSVAMAKKNAIMKTLPAVETLGSTSAINSDKTGTLTMNQMTVREITTAAHHYTVSGEGYSFEGRCSARRVTPRPTWTT